MTPRARAEAALKRRDADPRDDVLVDHIAAAIQSAVDEARAEERERLTDWNREMLYRDPPKASQAQTPSGLVVFRW